MRQVRSIVFGAGRSTIGSTVVPSFKLSFLSNVMLISIIDGTHHGRVAYHWPTRQQWLTPTSSVDLVCLRHEGSAVDCAFNALDMTCFENMM
eukprot:scaffold10181_cov182-Alexandrium_tamarense.AAC.8